MAFQCRFTTMGTFEALAIFLSSVVARVKVLPRASPSTLPRVISLRVAESQSLRAMKNFCVNLLRDIYVYPMPPR